MLNLRFKQRELNIKNAQKNVDKIMSEIKYYKLGKPMGIEDQYVA